MKIQLSDHFNYPRLLRFTFPSVIMMICTSIYGVVDGFFVSNFVGKTPFAAVNFTMPMILILGTIGFMFGTGGGALIAQSLGEGKHEKAQQMFSMFVYITIAVGIFFSFVSIAFLPNIARFLGADGAMLENSIIYGRIVFASLPFLMLQFEFESFFIVAEKPHLGLVSSLIAGCTNMVLDALFMVVFKWGVTGAAVATAISYALGGILPLVYFSRSRTTLLRLTKTKFNGRALLNAVTNGSSELMTNISLSVISMLYNIQLLKYAGENGVAAYGTIMYVNLIFLSIFIGYSTGSAPIIGYNFGARNKSELKNILKKSLIIISVSSVAMFLAAEAMGGILAKIFVGYDPALCALTQHAFMIYSISFLFSGISIYGSSFFTALGDGVTSALIAFLHTLVFQVIAVLILPIFFGINGIWFSVVASEITAAITTVIILCKKRKKYGLAED